MSCPTLADLPPPPPGHAGWPWTIETPQVPPTRPDGSPWPRISIVTPSYNQGQFIEETIRSILLQGYPDLEYIIIDGGSTDQTVEIIKKYESWLAYWVSEEDRGAPHAINKGLERGTGEICAWLNSDDIYREGVMQSVAAQFCANPQSDVISGVARMVSGTRTVQYIGPSPLRTMEDFCCISTNWTKEKLIVQPEAFFKASLYRAAGPIREDLKFVYDLMFWIAAADRGAQFSSVNRHWADFRHHPAQKTASGSIVQQELATAVFSYCSAKAGMDKLQFIRISSEIVELLERIATNERRRSEALRKSGSYRIGRLITAVPRRLKRIWNRRRTRRAGRR